MYRLARQNGHFQSQIVVSQSPSLFLSSQTILACLAIALWVHLGPIHLLVFLPANFSLTNPDKNSNNTGADITVHASGQGGQSDLVGSYSGLK